MRATCVSVAVVLGGCTFGAQKLESGAIPDAAIADAPGLPDVPGVPDAASPDVPRVPDAAVPDAGGGDCEWSFAPTGFDPCGLPESNGEGLIAGQSATIDTGSGSIAYFDGSTLMPESALLPQDGATAARVMVFRSLLITSQVRVIGPHPLVLVGLDSVEVSGDGVIDVSAVVFGEGRSIAGPGGDDVVACASSRGGAGSVDSGGGSGAGGGGFGAGGGAGGDADGATGGDGSPVTGTPTLSPLRGGCSGGVGGTKVGTGGAAGAGAGALQISAQHFVVLSGHAQLRASGAGGGAGPSQAGGGGGGGGGGILLEAEHVELQPSDLLSVKICANGGSGGEGGGKSTAGAHGVAGTCDLLRAETPDGGEGGDGGAGGGRFSTMGGSGGSGKEVGAGGGGGGVGRVRIRSVDGAVNVLGSVVTPAPVLD